MVTVDSHELLKGIPEDLNRSSIVFIKHRPHTLEDLKENYRESYG